MAMILSAFIPQVIQMLDDILDDEAIILGVIDELRSLAKKLEILRDILHDAESRSQRDRVISRWLNKLRDAMYDVDDTIDHCKTEGKKRRMLLEARSFGRVLGVRLNAPLFSCFTKVAPRHKIGDRIKSLNLQLDEVVKEASQFKFISTVQVDQIGSANCFNPQLSGCDIVGMQMEDAKSIAKLLTQDNQKTFYAITGVGGIGKTTLAQEIYTDERIKAHFQIKIWVCVTKQFIDVNILKEIISGAGGSYGEARTREQLETILKRTLEHKNFLLVLDDVWSNHVWQHLLRTPLRSKAAGSRILITTRNEAIADDLSNVHLHRIKPLTTKDAWSLLSKKVLHDGHGLEMKELTDIGLKIVRKCKGLPLAINTVAGVLTHKRRTAEEWEKVFLDSAWTLSDLPNDVDRALYLGYQDLSSHLKQCFVYCSLFPEDYVFEHRFIIQYWIAEGLVEAKEGMTMEQTAEGYYEELISRNLLLPDCNLHDGFKMHGLYRFLAHFVAGEENLFQNLSLLDAALTIPRRASIAARGTRAIPAEISRQEKLRTLLLFKNSLTRIFPDDLFQRLRCLRVFDVHDTEIDHLPSSIGDLIHLRYLNVSNTRLRQLPDTMEYLLNLQFLSVRGCELMNTLPKRLVRLQNLRSLDLVGTQINKMPIGLGQLENLNMLLGFMVDDGNEGLVTCTLEELGTLSQLTYLVLQRLERVSSGTEAARASLKNKHLLKSLVLNWSQRNGDIQRKKMEKFKEVLEELTPPASLEVIEIRGFPGLEHPRWMSSSLLTKLKRVVLEQCPFILQLPQLGHLPQLTHLYVSGATAVTTIGSEIFGPDAFPPFPQLDTLIIEEMSNLEDWLWQLEDGEALPLLRELQLINCPKLRSLPEGLRQAKALAILAINGADCLATVEELSSVKELALHCNSNLVKVSNLPVLEGLRISNCPALKKVEQIHRCLYLQLIDDSISCLPEELGKDTMKKLQWIEIECNEELFNRCLEGGSEWHRLKQIPAVHIRTKDTSKHASYCEELQNNDTNLRKSVSDMAIVPFVSNARSASMTNMMVDDIAMERPEVLNAHPSLSPSQRLLLVLCISLLLSALLDHLYLSPREILSHGANLISYFIDCFLIFITIPLIFVREIFAFLSYASSTLHKLIDHMEYGVDYISVSLKPIVELVLDFLFSSPSFFFIFILSSLAASFGGWFRP